MDISVFYITQKHYNIIVEQAQKTFPKECGGFLGGIQNCILAILPTFNRHLGNMRDTFGLEQDDMLRAHSFFQKNNLLFISVYHSHPKGIAWPSQADIDTGQKYHFIVSLRDQNTPKLAAFYISKKKVYPIPISILSEQKIQEKVNSIKPASSASSEQGLPNFDESKLMERIQNMRKTQQNEYDRDGPIHRSDSDFSTLA